MLNKIKKLVDSYINRKIVQIVKQQSAIEQEQFSYNKISQLFNESHFIPLTSWSISPSTILHVLNDININKRKSIIEFGSGASTIYIAKYLKTQNHKAHFFSVESDKDWVLKLKGQLKDLQIEDYVTIIYSPIQKVPSDIAYKTQDSWYATVVLEKELSNIEEFDVVIVDGPYGGGTPYARYSAVPFLKKKLSDNVSVFLDDIQRPEEQEIFKEWKSQLSYNSYLTKRYGLLFKKGGFITTPFKF